MEELNELEKIGLAFISGLVAGHSLEEADEKIEKEKKENQVDEIVIKKLEGKEIEEFIKMIKEMGDKKHE